MTKSERDLIRLINRRVATLQPDMARAMRAVYRLLTDEIGAARVVELIRTGRIEDIISEETLERATAPLRQQIRETAARGFRLTLPDVATVAKVPLPDLRNSIFFDQINPRVVRLLTDIESRTLDTLKENVRVVVRETVSAGLVRGEHPTAISRELREVIGISPQQAGFVRNMGDDLRNLDPRYFTRQLRDKRFDATVKKAFAEGKLLPTATQEKLTNAYARKYTKYNAELNTRAVTLDSYRLSQWESYASAIDREIIPRDRAEKVWIHFDPQKNPRETHKAYHGTIVGFYEPFPDGQQQAGVGYFNCRCATRYRVRSQVAFPQPLKAF